MVQCWILFELGLRITQNIRLTEDLEKNNESQEEPEASQRINKLILYGRCLFLVFVILELGSIIAYLGVETAVLNREERIGILSTWPTAVGWCFFSLSFVLFLSVYFLINRLNKKRDQVAST